MSEEAISSIRFFWFSFNSCETHSSSFQIYQVFSDGSKLFQLQHPNLQQVLELMYEDWLYWCLQMMIIDGRLSSTAFMIFELLISIAKLLESTLYSMFVSRSLMLRLASAARWPSFNSYKKMIRIISYAALSIFYSILWKELHKINSSVQRMILKSRNQVF